MKKHKVLKSLFSLLTALTLAVGLSSCTKNIKDTSVIAEGVSVMGESLSSLTKDEAKAKLDKIAKNFSGDTEIKFVYKNKEFSASATAIDLKADTAKTVEKAYSIGRGKNKKENKKIIKKAKKSGVSVDMQITYSKDKFLLVCSDYLGSDIADPTPMNVEIADDGLVVTNSIEGKIVDFENADKAIRSEFADLKVQNPVKISIIKYKPDNLTFEEFKKQYKREAKDAVYTKKDGEHNIVPEVIGVDFDDDEAKKIFEENKNSKEPYKIPAKITYPKVRAKALEDKYINNIIATYSTSYAGSSSGRIANIALAAQKIDGYVINPGKRFSYNDVVGPRTAAAGFKMAHVYVGTQVVDGIGGGICQVSSTLYNAVVMADLKTVSRTNHSMPVSYVPLGRDATVSYGTIDYIFENNKSYPVSIKAKAEGTTLTISIVGASDMDYTVEFATAFIQSVPYSTVSQDDDSLLEGETKVLQAGSNGSVYDSYRVYKKDGVEYKRTFESKSRYQSIAQKVAVGKKKEEAPPVNEPETEENNALPEENQADIPPAEAEVSGEITENTDETLVFEDE